MQLKQALQKTVLVVEDDADIRSVVQEILETEGYSVVTARDGKEALERLGQLSHPCLVLLDLRMPVMDGGSLMSLMKQIRDFQEVPVVVMTADAAAAPSEAQEVLSKPFPVEQLLHAVGEHCH